MRTTPTSCEQTREGLTEYLERALSPEKRQGLEAHLATCAHCTRVLEEMRATLMALRSLPRDTIPAPLKHRLLEELRDRKPR